VTGGPSRADFKRFATMLEEAMAAGAAGACIGRNVLAHPNPRDALRRVVEIVHGRPVLEAADAAMAAAQAADDEAGD